MFGPTRNSTPPKTIEKIITASNTKDGERNLSEVALPFIWRDRIIRDIQVMLRCKK
ncbi:32994_t:CDS:2, partial [Racocetra persica]